jgi:hypothetical protein
MSMARELEKASGQNVPGANTKWEYAGRVYFVNLDLYSSNQGQTLAIASALAK